VSSDVREIQPIPKNETEIDPAKIVFFCKNCKELVTAKQSKKKKFTFCCPLCDKTNIAFGTEESIRNHYRIKS